MEVIYKIAKKAHIIAKEDGVYIYTGLSISLDALYTPQAPIVLTHTVEELLYKHEHHIYKFRQLHKSLTSMVQEITIKSASNQPYLYQFKPSWFQASIKRHTSFFLILISHRLV